MTETVIKVEGLSKLYRLGELHRRTNSFRDKVTQSFSNMVRKARINTANHKTNSPDSLNSFNSLNPSNPLNPEASDKIWALRNVSFRVKRGEIVGIIGRNGAGKTTLLKVLSRITKPTKGHAWINGRVGSLLEVGTGFHQELTGRENIYLNGAILGMKRAEIQRKFDEIVQFAEIEKFIDTPVKKYSSGMYVRLAFAVAAHLEPEILLVDEVLAVGDAAFQKKCLGKMGDVAERGRTVLFVSHNMAAVAGLCDRTILLENGSIQKDGSTDQVIMHYLSEKAAAQKGEVAAIDDANKGYILFKPDREVIISCGDPLTFSFDVKCPEMFHNATAGIIFYDLLENPVIGASSKLQRIYGKGDSLRWRVNCDMGEISLNSGHYHISVWFGNEYEDYASFAKVLSLQIVPSDCFGWGKMPETWGYFFWKPQWEITPLQATE